MQSDLEARLTRLEAGHVADDRPTYRSFATVAELAACTDDLTGVKIYIGFSPDDWTSEAVNHDDDCRQTPTA